MFGQQTQLLFYQLCLALVFILNSDSFLNVITLWVVPVHILWPSLTTAALLQFIVDGEDKQKPRP